LPITGDISELMQNQDPQKAIEMMEEFGLVLILGQK
jgi:hypothetical protein